MNYNYYPAPIPTTNPPTSTSVTGQPGQASAGVPYYVGMGNALPHFNSPQYAAVPSNPGNAGGNNNNNQLSVPLFQFPGSSVLPPAPAPAIPPPPQVPLRSTKRGRGRPKTTTTSVPVVAQINPGPPVPVAPTTKRGRGRGAKSTATVVPRVVLTNLVLPPTPALAATATANLNVMQAAKSVFASTASFINNLSWGTGDASGAGNVVPPPPQATGMPPTPPDWTAHYDETVQSLETFKTFPVDPNTFEYLTLSGLFQDSAVQINKIEQIMNPELWTRFLQQRKEMFRSKSVDLPLLKKLGFGDTEIMHRAHISINFQLDPAVANVPYSDNMALLFHCTRTEANAKAILNQGLDERMGAGGLYGRGIYFSDDPTKAMQYDGTTGIIFICAVLLGDCCSVDNMPAAGTLVREPEKVQQQKRNSNDQFFDSIVARATGPHEFVLYNRSQCYPVYAVHYNRGSFAAASNNTSCYGPYRRALPPLAWAVKTKKGAKAMCMPPADGSLPWPFYAGTIFFDRMKVRNPEDETVSSSTDTPEDTEQQLINLSDDEDSVSMKMATLFDLGYEDFDKNKEVLQKYGYDMQRAINHLLDEQVEPEIMEIQDDSPDNTGAGDDAIAASSKAPVGKSNNSNELPDDIVDWILDVDASGTTAGNANRDNGGGLSANNRSPPTATVTIKEDCSICCNEYDSGSHVWKTLPCSHKLCDTCFSQIQATRTTMSGKRYTFLRCPFCQGTAGIEVGTCPNGSMKVAEINQPCGGYETCPSTIFITYSITDPKYALTRTAYLPNNQEGKEVLGLLRIAFDRRLIFTIGNSATSGAQNVLVWNIHHKTAMQGGVQTHGYPDDSYLSRVKLELKYYGIE